MKKLFNVGDKVQVNLEEGFYATDGVGIDEKINGATGVVKEINSFVFPYVVELDSKLLNKLITDTPRQFGDVELKAI